MKILNFITQYWDSLLVVILFIAAMIVLFVTGRKKVVKQILFALVTKAEQEFGSGTGALKKAMVISWIYEKLPAILKLMITEKTLDKWVEDALAYAKEKWASNEKLLDVK